MMTSINIAGASVPGASVSADASRRVAPQPPVTPVSDGADKEHDGDSDESGLTTATRGQKVNITA